MKTRTFKTVEEWMNSNPSKEVIAKVLKVANQSVITEIRQEYYDKKAELSKMENAIKAMERVELPVTKEITDKVKGLKKEVDELKAQLPAPKPRTKKEEPKKEIKKEEKKEEVKEETK